MAGRELQPPRPVGELRPLGSRPPARLRPHRPGHTLDRPVRAARPGPPVGRRATAPPRRGIPGRRPGRRAPHPALRPEAQRHHGPDDPACPARGRPHAPPPGQRPVVLPAPLDALVARLADGRKAPGSSLLSVPSPWLFPGRRPGSALTEDALAQRLHALGISPRQGRSTALFTLAAEVPAAILAKTLGIHVQAAIQWQKISGGDWAAYAADISRRGQAQEQTRARDQRADLLPGA